LDFFQFHSIGKEDDIDGILGMGGAGFKSIAMTFANKISAELDTLHSLHSER
jgi:hypothetical protein